MRLVLPFFLLSLSLAARAQPQAGGVPSIPNFVQIEPGKIYRGGRPSKAGMDYLKSIGVRTIINLEDDPQAVQAEATYAAKLGIREILAPITDTWVIQHASVERAVRALKDPSLYPIYLHCEHGKNRTGLVYGVRRVEAFGWEPKRAYKEMRSLGFWRFHYFLKNYFEWRTDSNI
jgi:tyrosine-protein phosphatase SIW14